MSTCDGNPASTSTSEIKIVDPPSLDDIHLAFAHNLAIIFHSDEMNGECNFEIRGMFKTSVGPHQVIRFFVVASSHGFGGTSGKRGIIDYYTHQNLLAKFYWKNWLNM